MNDKRICLTSDGPEFSRIVFGCWRIDAWQLTPRELLALIHAAVDLGVSTFDHADIYGDYAAETLFGQALALDPGLRQRIELVSKCGIKLVSEHRPSHHLKSYDTSIQHIQASVDNSLRALGVECLDLLLIHRPDPLMDADEVAEAFDILRRAGKVRHFGVSNFTPEQFALLHDRIPLVTNQVECSLLHLNPLFDGCFEQAQRLRTSPMLWSPLAGGRLCDPAHPMAARLAPVLERLAGELGVSLVTLLYAWLLRLPSRPLPLVGSRRSELLRQAVAALDVDLSREHWFRVLKAARGEELA